MPILTDEFLSKYKNVQPQWGYNGLGYIIYKRTYSRPILNDKNEIVRYEAWWETVRRCVEGAQEIGAGYTKKEAEHLFDLVFNLKCNFAGRMLWQLGTETVKKHGISSLVNCWFTSLRESEDFCFLFEMSMLGGGVGYSVKREDIHELPRIKKDIIIEHKNTKDADFIVPDSRSGWVNLLRQVIGSFFYTGKSFTYSTVLIRGAGEIIKDFGGIASGPLILIDGIQDIIKIFQSREGKKLRSIDVLDICNIIGSVVVSGNVRRSAQIAIGDPDDYLYLRAKRWDVGNIPNWRAMSNNSIYIDDYKEIDNCVWDGYNGTGEPYGFINIALAKKFGRTGEERIDNCEGVNPSMPKGVLVQIDKGIFPIEKLENQQFKVKNFLGEYVNAKCFLSSERAKVYKIKFGKNKDTYATAEHKWPVIRRGHIERIRTIDLKKGDRIPLNINEPLNLNGKYKDLTEEEGFFIGYLVGDGCLSKRKTRTGYAGSFVFHKTEEFLAKKILTFLNKQKEIPSALSYVDNCIYIQFSSVDFCEKLVNFYGIKPPDDKDIPSCVWESNDNFIRGFIDGMLSSDGCVDLKEGSIILVSSREKLISNFQKLLSFYGINSDLRIRTTSNISFPNGKKYDREYINCQLRIHKGMLKNFVKLFTISHPTKKEKLNTIFKQSLFSVYNCENEFVQVVSVSDFSEEKVWDISVDDEFHVFPSQFCFTGNCGEIFISDGEPCNLCDLYLNNIESKEELIECATLLYKTQKAVCTLRGLYDKTNKVVTKNMRLGLGVTGICQSLEKLEWLDDCYKALRKYDKHWSKENGWPESIRLTTVKPSGTLSLLSGSTPGAHPAYAEYYIRRVRMATNDPLVQLCRDHGYYVEYVINFDGTENRNTVIVEFPCYTTKGALLAQQTTAIQQLEMLKKMQAIWSDNSVSITVYYKKEELDEIKEWLKHNYKNNIKSVSFLLHNEHGFKQAPYEEIDEEKYKELSSKIKPFKKEEITDTSDSELKDSMECSSGHCPIK